MFSQSPALGRLRLFILAMLVLVCFWCFCRSILRLMTFRDTLHLGYHLWPPHPAWRVSAQCGAKLENVLTFLGKKYWFGTFLTIIFRDCCNCNATGWSVGTDIFLLFITQAVRIFETSNHTQKFTHMFPFWYLAFKIIKKNFFIKIEVFGENVIFSNIVENTKENLLNLPDWFYCCFFWLF